MLHFLTAVPEGRVFGLDLQTAFEIASQLINASILAGLLFFILYKPVRNFMQKRAERVKAQMDRAAADMATADTLKAQYQENLAGIEGERVEILDSAHRLAAQKSKGIVDESKSEAEAIKKQARLDIQYEQEQVKDALKLHVIALSSAMAAKIVAHAVDPEVQDRLFYEALSELEDAAWPR